MPICLVLHKNLRFLFVLVNRLPFIHSWFCHCSATGCCARAAHLSYITLWRFSRSLGFRYQPVSSEITRQNWRKAQKNGTEARTEDAWLSEEGGQAAQVAEHKW